MPVRVENENYLGEAAPKKVTVADELCEMSFDTSLYLECTTSKRPSKNVTNRWIEGRFWGLDEVESEEHVKETR